ncbi:MAG: discoidin domain-containing protein [Leptodesmis sp.]|uniref:discoidin domain-containing protein n=1 Tax=Leptodesmis sp. TaxID=3100501 RepID=UPI003D108B2D
MFTFPVAIYSQGSVVSLVGDVGISAAIAANLSTGSLLGNVGISASTAGSLSLAKPLASAVTVATTLAGDTTLAKPLTAGVAISSSLAGDTSLTKSLAGSISVSAALAGDFYYNTLLLDGNVAIASSLTGDTSLTKPLAGATAISSSLASSLSLTKLLAGDTAIASSLVGAIYDPATTALLARFSGTYTTAQQQAIDALISGLKTDGLWSTIDVLHVVAGSTAQADALLNWKSSSYNLSITGSLTYTLGRNFSGFTASNYLSDGFVPSSAGGNFVQNSATIAIYSTGDGQSGGVAIGAISSNPTIYNRIFLRNSNNQMVSEMNGTSQLFSSPNTIYTAVGLSTSTRTGASATALYKNSTQLLTGTQASTGNQSIQIDTGVQNNNGTRQSADPNLALVTQVKASGWTSTQVGNFYSRLNTYLQTLKTASYTLTYSSDGDTNGLFYLLGTNMGMQPWANPAQNSNTDTNYSNNYKILLSASSISGNLSDFTDRATSSSYTSTNTVGQWVKVDIGGFRSLSCNKYSIRHYTSSSNYPRNWKLQGSNDNSTWTDLDVRSSDTTINAANAWGTFTCNQGVNTAFRWFRILNNGLTSSGTYYICLGEWELYGTLTIGTPTTFTRSGLNGDNAGIIYYLASSQADENWTYGWVNPHATGIVSVSASSVGSGNVSMLVNRLPNTFSTNNSPNSWIQLDFGASRTVRVDAYQLRSSSSSPYLRNWKLQGSNDGSSWTDLDIRTSDTTFTATNQWGNWTVNQGNTSYWRYIRVLSTGVDSGGTNYLRLGQIELYGAIA